MKKIYMNPNLKVIRIESHRQMLVGSQEVGGYTDQNLSREFDYEDEEDYEE